MDTKTLNQEEFVQNWYETAEFMLTNDKNQLTNEEIDQLLAEATYNMSEEEAEGFFNSLRNIASKGLKTLAPIAGTVVGGAIGGPVGAQLGGTLGGIVSKYWKHSSNSKQSNCTTKTSFKNYCTY